MACSESEVTVEWPRCGLELRPYSANIRFDRGQFNLVRTDFSKNVGDYLRNHTTQQGSILREPQEVAVKINGTKQFHVLYRPEDVRYKTDGCSIEFHDPQKHLGNYIVDTKWQNIPLKKAYEKLFARVSDNSIIKGIKVDIPGDARVPDSLPNSFSTVENDSVSYTETSAQRQMNTYKKINGFITDSEEKQEKILNAKFNIDLPDQTVLEAIWKLNDAYHLTAWTGRDGYLYVGEPETSATMHVASPDDRRVWKATNANVSHPREPIKKVVAKGDMMDSPQDQTTEDIKQAVSGFLSGEKDASAYKDLMPQGVAQRTDVLGGQSISIRVDGAKSDSLPSIAYNALLNEMRAQNTGSVQINPQLSGKTVSDYESVAVGDFIHVVPSDGGSDCTPSMEREIYVITGVMHDFSGGGWSIDLDVQMYPDNPVATMLRYFDPLSGDNLTEEQVFG